LFHLHFATGFWYDLVCRKGHLRAKKAHLNATRCLWHSYGLFRMEVVAAAVYN